MNLLKTDKVTGSYGDFVALKSINLEIITGEWLSIIGANGSGKSTLLKLLARLLSPQTGKIFLNGKDIHNQPTKVIAQQLALLPQQQTIPTGLTVRQLVSLGRSPHQPWWRWELDGEDREKIETALVNTQMMAMSDRPVEQLSGGERQRAFLALALAQNAQILLLDEPTTYLDIRYQLELLELLKQLNQEQGLTVLTVLHEINLAARFSSRIALLNQGEVLDLGSPKDVLNPNNLAQAFGLEVVVLDTPVGLQICPLQSVNSSSF